MLKNWSNHFLSWIKVQSRGPFWDNLFLFFLLFNLRSAQLRVSLVIACMTRPYAVLDRGALIHNRRVDLRFLWLTYLLPPMLSSDWISMRTTILAAFDFPLLLAPSGALIATTTLSFSPIMDKRGQCWVVRVQEIDGNIANGTTDLRVELISQFLSQILFKFQFKNRD